MNLSVVERMAREGDMSADALQYLLQCRGECEWLDYKAQLHLDHDKDLCDFARDVLAIKNTGGGYILVGVQDKTWNPVGLQQELPFDSKLLRDQLRKATAVDLEIDIVHHRMQVQQLTRCFALIYVRSSKRRKRRRTPTLVKKDYCSKQDYGLRRGEIYLRRGDSTVRITDQHELEELLDHLEEQTDHDALALTGLASPFAIDNGTYRLLEKGFEQFIGRDSTRTSLVEAVTKDPRIWIVNVHGPGGAGKTALVNWAVYEFFDKGTFEAIVQLTAKDTVLTTRGIERFGRTLYSLDSLLDNILALFDQDAPSDLSSRRNIAIECLSAWRTLLVLDNMETVRDGRILDFVQSLPPNTKTKVLMTSRQKTGGWELPFSVNELTVEEVQEFVRIRAREMGINFPNDGTTARKVWQATGGLPLAVQWVLGRYRADPQLDKIASEVTNKDSPVLEFSFRNIWSVLSQDARAVLATMTIFDSPPTLQMLGIASEFPLDKIEKALSELTDVTLVNRVTSTSDGRVTYVSLPITLAFARNQLAELGEYEVQCRQRYQKFAEQTSLQESELHRFRSRFAQFGLESDSEKRAAVLCQRGESEMFVGNIDNAELLFRQARDTAPQSAYVYAMSASYELARNRVGNAIGFAEKACSRANKKTGALCYTIKARILDIQRDRAGRVEALAKALEFSPNDYVVRHQYGVALSRSGNSKAAVEEFSIIINAESQKPTPTLQLLMALKTRIINLKRLGRNEDAKNDLDRASRILKEYPTFSREAHQFAEFLDQEVER